MPHFNESRSYGSLNPSLQDSRLVRLHYVRRATAHDPLGRKRPIPPDNAANAGASRQLRHGQRKWSAGVVAGPVRCETGRPQTTFETGTAAAAGTATSGSSRCSWRRIGASQCDNCGTVGRAMRQRCWFISVQLACSISCKGTAPPRTRHKLPDVPRATMPDERCAALVECSDNTGNQQAIYHEFAC